MNNDPISLIRVGPELTLMNSEDDLRAQLEDLEQTLSALREELDENRRPRRPRPPSPLELLRFTESHTLPTLVATLEATIQALELLRGFLRLVDPEASERAVGDVPPGARETAGRALADLRSALEGTDVPDDPVARDLVADARELAADVESRLDATSRPTDEPGGTAGVAIDVRDEGDEKPTDAAADADVESELDSIRDEIRGEEGDEE